MFILFSPRALEKGKTTLHQSYNFGTKATYVRQNLHWIMWDLDVAHKYTIPWHEHKKKTKGRGKWSNVLFGVSSCILLLLSATRKRFELWPPFCQLTGFIYKCLKWEKGREKGWGLKRQKKERNNDFLRTCRSEMSSCRHGVLLFHTDIILDSDGNYNC